MGKFVRFIILSFIFIQYTEAQVAPYALSPRWVFGNLGQFDFTTGSAGSPGQPARTDNIIANEGSSTICLPNKNLLTYDNNVRVAGSNHTPLGPFMIGSSSSTQGGLLLNNPSVAAGTSFFWITANAEQTYPTQEPNDNPEQGWRVYSGSQSGTTVTAPSLAATLTTAVSTNPWESVYASSDGSYGYYILNGGAKSSSTGEVIINAWNLSAAGVVGSVINNSYSTNWWGAQAQASIKINRCQTKIAVVNGPKLGVFNWNRTTGTLGSVIKDLDVNVGGGSKLYGCEFSVNGNYVYVTSLGGSDLAVVDLTVGGTTTGLSYFTGKTASGSLQIGPDDVIYVANGLDPTSVSTMGIITNANTGGTYNPTGLALANGSTVRLGIANIPWLNPQKPTATIVNNSCGSYTFTPVFETHYSDVITYNKAIWDFGDGTATVTNSGASAVNPVTHVYTTGSTGSKTITLTLTDNTCSQDWVGTVVQSVPCILPVELISFDANAQNGGVNLNWQTATEINDDYFEVQRSIDGIHFETIAKKTGAGNSNVLVNYSYFDGEAKGSNKLYYKLVQHDFDGKTQSSQIVVVNLDKTSAVPIAVAPNPFNESFVLTKLKDQTASIIVYDIVGRVVEQKNSLEGEVVIQLGSSLVNGTYIVEYITAESSYTVRVEKQ